MNQNPILVIEDDLKLREAIEDTLQISGYKTVAVSSISQAMKVLEKQSLSLIISDMNLGQGADGIQLLKQVKTSNPELPVLIITAYGSIENAVSAIKYGAQDYLTKPFVPEKLIDLVQRYALNTLPSCDEPTTKNIKMQKVLDMAKRVASTHVTVLLSGESGTGKEVLAKYIHKKSKFSQGPFVAINCAAIPENMLEAILFGYEKGSFTGANNTTTGKFEQAEGGTLLLDEISEMPLELQVKLLRVLQEKEVERLGGKKTVKLNIRVIAATNKDLKEEVEKGLFRKDLYFRLSVFPLYLLPLRERKEDIISLSNYILTKQAPMLDRSCPLLSKSAQEILVNKKWLGNIRELENVLQRVMIISFGENISENILTADDFKDLSIDKMLDLETASKKQEYEIIMKALNENNGCRKLTAKVLGISDRTLRHKMAKMREVGISIPNRNFN